MWEGRSVFVRVMMGMFDSIEVPAVSYECDSWALNSKERERVDVLEMKCQTIISGVRQVDLIRNDSKREVG